MKNLFKIGALSLALIAAVFMMNTNAQTSPTAQLNLKIAGTSGYCTYGSLVEYGIHAFSYTAVNYDTGFLTTGGDAARYCDDTEGKSNWNVTLQSSTVEHATTPVRNITPDRVFVSDTTPTMENGSCTVNSGSSNGAFVPLDEAKTLFGKVSALGEVCKIQTASVNIRVAAVASQAVGTYSGTLTLSIPLP